MRRPVLYRFAAPLLRIGAPVLHAIRGQIFDPVRMWTGTRDLPPAPPQSFKEFWRNRHAKR
jgi:hypothetical protein